MTDALLNLAKTIADRASDRPRRPTGKVVTVLMQFDVNVHSSRFKLFAGITDDADRASARTWFGDIAMAVPSDIGSMAGSDIGTKAETRLELIENSHAADLSKSDLVLNSLTALSRRASDLFSFFGRHVGDIGGAVVDAVVVEDVLTTIVPVSPGQVCDHSRHESVGRQPVVGHTDPRCVGGDRQGERRATGIAELVIDQYTAHDRPAGGER